MNNYFKQISLFFLAYFLICTSSAQAPTPAAPLLPAPTDAQLQRGSAILEKMLHIVQNVPLSKPSEVFRVFGIDQPEIYPDRFRTGDFVLIQINATNEPSDRLLIEQGIHSLSADYPFNKALEPDIFRVSLTRLQACVSIDEVRKIFWPITSKTDNHKLMPRIILDDFRPAPAPMHEYQLMRLDIPNKLPYLKTTAEFYFNRQTCAENIVILNAYNLLGELTK